MTSIEEAVWFYYEKGFSIIPLGVNKENDLKKPSIIWEAYHTRLPTKKEINEWLDDGLFANIGICCGAVSKNLVIFDIDDMKIPEEIGITLSNIWKTGSWVTATGRGYHIWMIHHSNPGGIKKPTGYSVEYRANHGYCIVPPSTHPSGATYKFMDGYTFETLPDLIQKDAKSIFEDLKNKIGTKRGIQQKIHVYKPTTSNTRTIETQEKPECVKLAFQKKFEHPNRYYTKYGIISSAVMRGIPKEEARKELMNFDLNNCVPPEGEKIVSQAVEGAYGKDAHLYGCEFWMDDAGLCPFENIMECPYGKKKAKRELAKKYKFFTYREDVLEDGRKIFVKDKVIPPNLAQCIMNEFDYHFFTVRDSNDIYYYQNGLYHDNGETIIATVAEDIMEDLSTIHRKNEIISHIRDYNYKDRDEITAPINLINVKNGLLDINTCKLISHSPNYYFINQIPVVYDPDADYKKFETFLQDISKNKGVIRQTVVDTIQEYMGFSLYRSYPYKYYVVLDGGGDNGKTVLMNVVLSLVGEANNTSVQLQELNERPFARAQLFGKYTNISDDLPKKALKYTGVIKQITGNSSIWADVKNCKKGISFVSYAKPWYACNELPETNDFTDAFFSRQLQITLLNKYLPAGDSRINNSDTFERNVHIKDELTTPEGLSGILNFSLIGLKRLLERKIFSDDTTTDEKRTAWVRKTNPVAAYLEDNIETASEDFVITVDDFYNSLLKYCESNGFDKPTSKKYVTERVLSSGWSIKKQQKTIDNEPRVWCWAGLRSVTDLSINKFLGRREEGTIF